MNTSNERSSGELTRPAPPPFVMYAVRALNEIYHLVTRGGQDTMCGLRVSRITSDGTGNRLQIVRTLPADRNICKHCERIKKQDMDG
jgi:hypothetical protein